MPDRFPSMLGRLIEWDHSLFRRINQEWVSDRVDPVAIWIRESTHWIPLYAALLALAVWKLGRTGLIWFLFGSLAVSLTDLIGNYGFKHVFERLRPCNDPVMQNGVRLLVERCGAGFSFVSNHAANHMCLAFFLWFSMPERIGRWGWLAVVWALGIGYAQIYVGLHFPSDMMAGSLLGALVGWGIGRSFDRRYKNSIFPLNQPMQ